MPAQSQLLLGLAVVLKDEAEVERIFLIIRAQREY